uniref:Uncharacterized protein n=1 Tax=Lactuca sativa TaxID=4236 RepID=A0A9R1VG77_LACSA|nr:hypothetical protein LSAT_V11C500247390 [Lactuca sativa]
MGVCGRLENSLSFVLIVLPVAEGRARDDRMALTIISHPRILEILYMIKDLVRRVDANSRILSVVITLFGDQSEASSNVEDFYGVELNVKGLKSLDESLDDNPYFYDSCATRKKLWGHDLTHHELFLYTHTKNHDGVTFLVDKAKKIHFYLNTIIKL